MQDLKIKDLKTLRLRTKKTAFHAPGQFFGGCSIPAFANATVGRRAKDKAQNQYAGRSSVLISLQESSL